MKKKMLIHINNIDIGGAEKSLINFIEYYKGSFDITLLVSRYIGGFVDNIPKEVKVIELYRYNWQLSLHKLMTLYFPSLLNKFIYRKLDKDFEYVIAYLEIFPTITLKDLPCTVKKIAFLHNNLQDLKKQTRFPIQNAWKAYSKYDYIACVSEDAKNALLSLEPSYENKVRIVNNLQNEQEIIKKSQEHFDVYDKQKINFVTVARFEPQKSLDRIVNVAKKIESENIIFHIVGTGSEFERIDKRIVENNLLEKVVLHGAQENPYKFIAHADALLMVSKFEGFPMVFQEAKILKTPILTTNVSDAKFSIDKIYGYVCENDEESIQLLVESVEENKEMLKKIEQNYQEQNFDVNKSPIDALNQMISIR